MTMQKQPLTILEEKGLKQYGLPVNTDSLLSDSFRLGMAWQANIEAQGRELTEHEHEQDKSNES